ncbi:LacI family DNA-binding transcriptional regulator [Ramlibacter albus]|uniref:LacI family DNA-binding transcriptional regulator n=1 Tax=Ramlibacter albus TaxID=2079448 RepID=A0A923MAN4_9BURK|nr:LacI family DNA-binding transcriptional regulator [Ramlibacter albus]MBC5766756.1 LacI family DNA-binding transcriptional regulator [Ramlibacter albus]
MKDLPSINAVAELADVSIATVSRVLNKSKPVSEQTRLRVEAAVAQLGYRANPFGRSLAKAQSHLLLVLVPDFSNPFYSQIIKGIEAVTRRRGYKILIADDSNLWTDRAETLDLSYFRLVDGVISLTHLDERPELMAEMDTLPWVACSEYPSKGVVPHVSIDHRQAAVDAVQYLLNGGHKRIALITAEEDYLWAQQRREGYEIALQRAGIQVDPNLIRTANDLDYESGGQAAGSLLALPELPTAVFAMSDTLAIGVIKALRRKGKRVPEDIAVIGFDNLPLSSVFEPALTTIAQPMRELGEAAAQILLERLAGGTSESRTLAHRLVLRESA